jgi:hypothetical protein
MSFAPSPDQGAIMRRLAVTLLGVLALALPSVSAASTTVARAQVDRELQLCNGDIIHLTGTLMFVSSINGTSSGGLRIASHFQPQGLSGVDEQTGVTYQAVGLTREITDFTPGGGIVDTYIDQFHIQATQGAESYELIETAHVTITPAGDVTASFDNLSLPCQS